MTETQNRDANHLNHGDGVAVVKKKRENRYVSKRWHPSFNLHRTSRVINVRQTERRVALNILQ